jgi:ligand-binding SRPBCC domain-containing protein
MTDHALRNVLTFKPSPSGVGCRLEAAQFVAEQRGRVFELFADAFQLEALTPPWMKFSVRTPRPIQMREGARINYRLRLRGVPIRWQSRIEVWEPPQRFVDVQTRGPYRLWRHQHLFEVAPGGTICRDIVDYVVPGGWLVDRLFVREDVRRIFEFRQRKLREIFAPAEEVNRESPRLAQVER